MSHLKHPSVPGAWFFVTVVTRDRLPLLLEYPRLFAGVWMLAGKVIPFTMHSWVLLPDHFHAILSSDSVQIGEVIKRFKLIYNCKYAYKAQRRVTTMWQPQFYEHGICDEADLRHRLGYMARNPIKHGLVSDPSDWPWILLP